MEEVTFSDFQNDERYKKLERTLKLASFKKRVRQEEKESWHLPMSPSMSSINVDASDVNTNIPDSRAVKIGSEVVSSSKNLRNMVLKKRYFKNNHETVSSSSIGDLNKTNDLQDHFIMPPPNFNFIPRSSKKANSTPLPNINRNVSVYSSKCASSDVNEQSVKLNNSASPQISPNKIAYNRIRIFTGWKVILNEQKQLIIQGTINGSQFARSKPIVRRLMSTKIQSISNHIYQLQGNIVDEECELPDYVRGKFYNGFPDDWENVHQIWQLYIQQGSRLTFRWPTPLADSDDDLRSEITDFTFASIETEDTSPPKSFANLKTNQNKQNFTVLSSNTSKDNRCPYKDNKTNKLEDKLNVIVNCIKDQNCSEEFVNKVIDIFDCLHYVVSYGSSKENESNMETSTSMQDKSIVQEQKKHISNKSIPPYNPIEFEKDKCKNINAYRNRNTPSKDSSLKLRNHSKTNNRIDKDTSDSESEIYTGIPKISVERILQQREVLAKPHKRKTRLTKLSQQYCEVQGKKPTSLNNIRNSNNTYCDDSGVSIIGDQTEFLGMTKLTNSKIENNVHRDVNLSQTIREQWKEVNVSTEKINAHEMLEHFVEKDSMPLYKLTRNFSDSSDIDECDTGEINGTLENKNVGSETNIQNETSKKRNYIIKNNQYQPLNKTCKPIVISSEAIDTNKIYKKMKQAKTVNEDGKESEKEIQPLVQKKSPIKTLNAIENINSDVLIDNNLKEYEGSKNLIQLNQTHIYREEQGEDINAKKLTGWAPVLKYNPVLCLTFEGKLMNDAGHVVKRRFQTDAVLRRISPKLIETISHKFYTLVGDLNNHKHVIPKQLVNQCRNGCPTRIDQFCKTWESLQCVSEIEDDIGNGIKNIRMSSKGRRIIPPLSYWTGERVSMKHNKSVYIPGSSHDSSVEYKSLNKNKSMNKTTNQENNSHTGQSLNELKSPENTENTKEKVVKGRKKKKIAQELSDSSDAVDITSPLASKRQRFTSYLPESSDAVCTTNSPRKLHERCLGNERTEWKARSNTKQITSSVKEM